MPGYKQGKAQAVCIVVMVLMSMQAYNRGGVSKQLEGLQPASAAGAWVVEQASAAARDDGAKQLRAVDDHVGEPKEVSTVLKGKRSSRTRRRKRRSSSSSINSTSSSRSSSSSISISSSSSSSSSSSNSSTTAATTTTASRRVQVVVVDQSWRGGPAAGHFTSIQQAVNSVPTFNAFRVTIQVNPGIYREKVSIPWNKPFITLQGANGSKSTIIEWDDSADRAGDDGKPLGTFNTATVAIDAPYFIARNLTFKNATPYPTGGAKSKQASAIRVSGDACAFVGCQFLGAQDTLYDHKGRHFFQECYIEGSVDFIFGDGLSMYQNCHLHAIGAHYQALTAQHRESPLEDSGFSFVNCKVTGTGLLYLGRAWGTFSRVIYAYTYMESIIVPQGWYNWGDPKRQGTVYYGEYKCSGPGANAKGRVMWSRQLSDEEAQPFLDLSFVDGKEWIGL